MIIVKQCCDICKTEITGEHYEVFFNSASSSFINPERHQQSHDFCPECMKKILAPFQDILDDEPEFKPYDPKLRTSQDKEKALSGYEAILKSEGLKEGADEPPSELPFEIPDDAMDETAPVPGSITGGSDEVQKEPESVPKTTESVKIKVKNVKNRKKNVLKAPEDVTEDVTEVPEDMTDEDRRAKEITEKLFANKDFAKAVSEARIKNPKGFKPYEGSVTEPKKKRGRPKRLSYDVDECLGGDCSACVEDDCKGAGHEM